MRSLLYLIWSLAGLATNAIAQSTLSVEVSSKRPCSAKRLPGDLIGLSLEADRWNDWAGSLAHPNDFTHTLLDNLKQKTGVAPSIRVGGATQDLLTWTPGINGVENVYAPVPDNFTSTKQLFPECLSGKIGGDWYLLSSNLPAGTSFIWGVNLKANKSSEIIAQVTAIKEAFSDPRLSSVALESVELGNEPDYWAGLHRPQNWSVPTYLDQYNQFVEEIYDEIGSNDLKFQMGAFAGNWEGTELSGTDIFQTTLGKSSNSFSEHRYSNIADFSTRPPSTWPAVRSQLVTKSNIRGNLTRFASSAAFFHENDLRFYLGETNTMFGHGMPGVSNSAAAAIWAIDYILQAATLGVDTLHFHAGVGYNYSAFQPIDYLGRNITDFDSDAKRRTMPIYTGFIAIADAIGKHDDTWVSEISISNDHVAAYSIWQGSKLDRIMLINSTPWEASSHGARPRINVTFPGIDVSRAKFKQLFSSSLGALSGITWGGQSWETYSGHVEGRETFEVLRDQGNIRLDASSAVLVYL